MKPIPKAYDHKEREKFWQDQWFASDVYHFRDDQPREQTFVIDTPPPTVSGVLHMGHIFSYTQADFVARYQRMIGKDVFYPMGFDDNGLPTERLVEKIKGVRGSAMPRAEFVTLCRDVVKEAEDEFRHLFKSTALSVDWRKEYQTISDDVRKLSQASFVDLLKKGEAYRDFRPTYWDWVDQTAIAQAEIEEKEQPGIQCTIPFGLMDFGEWDKLKGNDSPRPSFDSLQKVPVMTTRPELLGACVALMCHPDDEVKLQNKVAVSPLFNVVVPIYFDEKVDKEKGTGFVMCCSWGDDTDKEWIAKYNLAWRPLIDLDGRIRLLGRVNNGNSVTSITYKAGRNTQNNLHMSALSNWNCFDVVSADVIFSKLENSKLIRDIKNENSAKGRALELLAEAHLLLPLGDTGEAIIHKTQSVKCAERSGTSIEIVPTHQWFVKVVDKKEALLAKGAQCQWHPEYMRIRLNQWIEGLKEDWCISRQRFFGVPFPVWYSKRAGEEGKLLFADVDQLPVDPMVDTPTGYSKDEVTPDMDVMDTWATSSISPQINAGTLEKCKLFPADIRPQAHEIIRTWAFYTIAKAHLHADTIPWKNLMISGWCLAADKTKMSKSKGNVVTPVALIEEKGTDAVRYWASTSRLGTDTAFSEDLLKIGRKLVNKLWNASQFAAINLDKLAKKPTTAAEDAKSGVITEALDLWILSRLNQCIKKATAEFERFEYCDARVAIEDFFWNDFCDNYLELAKARSYGESGDNQQSALCTIYHCLDAILRLFAPFVPHICEEIFSHLFENQGSVHARGTWPKAEVYPYDASAELAGMASVDILNVIRKAKSEAGVSIKHPVDTVFISLQSETVNWAHVESILDDLKAAGTAKTIEQSHEKDLPVTSDKGWFKLRVVLAKPEVHARNSDQKPHEKIEGNVLHAPGKPDLSKHVVKVQVNDLPETLKRQK